MAGFQAILDKLRIATNEAVAAPPTEQAAIGPILNVVGGFCNECHQAFRIQTN
jgi:cytochrome c556